MATKWLIWSVEHGRWWQPNEMGYTKFKSEAGIYSFKVASDICAKANAHLDDEGVPQETMLPYS
jgi:hypothetical protein